MCESQHVISQIMLYTRQMNFIYKTRNQHIPKHLEHLNSQRNSIGTWIYFFNQRSFAAENIHKMAYQLVSCVNWLHLRRNRHETIKSLKFSILVIRSFISNLQFLPWGNPTVCRAKHFKPEEDIQALRYAIKGCGTNENVLVNILCNRSNEQRQVNSQ